MNKQKNAAAAENSSELPSGNWREKKKRSYNSIQLSTSSLLLLLRDESLPLANELISGKPRPNLPADK